LSLDTVGRLEGILPLATNCIIPIVLVSARESHFLCPGFDSWPGHRQRVLMGFLSPTKKTVGWYFEESQDRVLSPTSSRWTINDLRRLESVVK
jgi:hypothetical protein